MTTERTMDEILRDARIDGKLKQLDRAEERTYLRAQVAASILASRVDFQGVPRSLAHQEEMIGDALCLADRLIEVCRVDEFRKLRDAWATADATTSPLTV